MATLELDSNAARYQIRAYTPGKIIINEQAFSQNLIITPLQLIENWSVKTLDDINIDSLQIIVHLKPEILLIGTGSLHHFLPLNRYGDLINLGIGVEIMNTLAACHTYNALSAENRNVAAALMSN